jgi:predicted PurR-regulated permease PerM
VQIRHIFTQHWRVLVFLILLVLFFAVVYNLRSVLLPFIFGLLLAYILHPGVLWLEKVIPLPPRLRPMRRVFVVVLVMLTLLLLIVLVASYMIATLVNTVNQLLDNAETIISAVTFYFSDLFEAVRSQFSPSIQQQITDFFSDASNQIGDAIATLVTNSVAIIPTNIGFVLGFASLPIFLFYLLKDWEKLGDGLYNGLPRSMAVHTRNVLAIIGNVLGRYIRAQLLLGFIVGSLTFISLLVMRVNFGLALLIGIIAGVFEMVPTIGPWVSGIFGVVIILATYPELIGWVIGLFLLIQFLENNLLVPRIQGQALRIHPAIALLLLVVGAYMAGLWGIILALPLAATIVQLFGYVHDAARAEDHLPLLYNDASIFEK